MSEPDSATPAASPGSTRTRLPLIGALGRLLLLLLALGLAGLACGGIALALAYRNLPDLSALTDYRPKLPMRVFSAEGTLLGEFGDERRQFVAFGDIPRVMKDAVLAIEDARFYEHGGVDYRGVLRAAVENLRDAHSQGASTITMQVARNFYLSTEKTLTRKLYEVLLALDIERHMSKEQILEVYMNQIYLGQRAYGFAAASEIYFGKPLKDLTIAEAAMLAGLPKAPSAYNPIANPRRAATRQQYIIDRMLENGFINAEQHALAKAQVLKLRRPTDMPVHAEYVAETARQLIYSQYGPDAYTRGLHVYTTIRAADQAVAYRALRKGLMDYERRQVYRGPEAFVDLPADPKAVDARVAEALSDRPDNDELRAAVVLEASPKKVVAALQSGDLVTVTGDGLRPVTSGLSSKAEPKVQIRRGAVVRVIKGAKGDWTMTQLPEVEGAFVSMDPRTGALVALVGGFDWGKNKFNHVTQAWRQPGSSFKPFIYSAALEKGFTPSTIVNDGPLFFDAGSTGSQPWEPKNYDGTFDGPIPLRRALAKSKNMVSIRVLQSIGVGYARDWVTRFGFDRERHEPYLTMALGAGSVTPLQMVTAYGVFANGGHRMTPLLVSKVTDDRGKLLFQAPARELTEASRAIDARNAFLMSSLLQEVTRSGTAARAQATLKRSDIYGKTGTTNDSMDAWFAGYHPTLAAVVWIGYDTPRKLGDRETGGGLSLPVWIEYMATALQGVAVAEMQPPAGIVNIGNEWYFEEFGPGAGVGTLRTEDEDQRVVPQAPSDDERRSILDLFKR
ncbi:penicillin-binding protein 1A [Ideonella sp. 4Y16]|uniref:penicillin-binding protein 1A n=1 Tax=Ideonella alba TaxID=2824118 RepID=UPI001B362170|nr:penicillin-binding protein 1A [Ideonella alba]MBQ0944393.1 penicillin-binding protein 1A [Ideonella alba]